MRSHLCYSALVLLTMWGCGGSAAVTCRPLLCPAGQEPSQPCQRTPAEESECRSCPAGTFSESFDADVCRPHTSCELLRRSLAAPGTSATDAVCGDCLPGFHATSKGNIAMQTHCEKNQHERVARTVVSGPDGGAGDPINSTVMTSAEEKTTEYAVFALVPVFCIMGLLGILICNILKKKGYKCSAEKEGGDEENATPQKEGNSYPYISDDVNEDTISVLVRIIAEKKENAAALEELLLEYENKQMAVNKSSSIKFPLLSLSTFRPLPKLCPHQSHLHTISGLSGLAPKHGYRCTRCAQKKWPAVFIPPLNALKDPLKPAQTLILPSLDKSTDQQKSPLLADACTDQHRMAVPNIAQEKVEDRDGREGKEGELKVLSVGRFQVAQIPEYKPVVVETKKPPQTKRNSLFGGLSFSSATSIWR